MNPSSLVDSLTVRFLADKSPMRSVRSMNRVCRAYVKTRACATIWITSADPIRTARAYTVSQILHASRQQSLTGLLVDLATVLTDVLGAKCVSQIMRIRKDVYLLVESGSSR